MSIVITDLCKSFGSTPVLQRFTWTVDRPMVLMGRSGCGKTTLLRILLGLESANSGTVTGVETPAAVFQEDRLCPQLTAAANLTLTGHGLTPQDAERELRTLGFTDAELALPAARLSGGQKRRAALLRALLCRDAKTLLLDEPFTGMDAELVEDAVAATKRLTGERPTILVTHDRTAVDLLGWPVREVEKYKKRTRGNFPRVRFFVEIVGANIVRPRSIAATAKAQGRCTHRPLQRRGTFYMRPQAAAYINSSNIAFCTTIPAGVRRNTSPSHTAYPCPTHCRIKTRCAAVNRPPRRSYAGMFSPLTSRSCINR